MKQLVVTFLLLFSFANASAQQPKPSAPPRSKGDTSRKITGRVLDETGKPVHEAAILAMPTGKSDDLRQVIANYRSVSTDELGKFEFEALTPGAYRLTAAAPGYVLAQDSVEEGGRPKFFRPGDTVTLRLVKGGVITGTVTDGVGEPVVGTRLRAHKIKDDKGRPAMIRADINESTLTKEWKTDDRGIYRIYGLEAGTYVVAAGGKGLNPMALGAYDNDAPTYHPTGTRDTAAPVIVQVGQEVASVDIRYRDNKGYIVSGKIINPTVKGGATSVVFVTLTNAATGNLEGLGMSGFMSSGEGGSTFSLGSIGDGEYSVAAMSTQSGGLEMSNPETMLLSPSRRVTVKGADVTGLELVLSPIGLISGNFVLEKLKSADANALTTKVCQPKRDASIEETVIVARSDAGKKAGTPIISLSPFNYTSDGVPDEKGEFRIMAMEAGRYRFDIKLPADEWYINSITQIKDAPRIAATDETVKGETPTGEVVKGETAKAAKAKPPAAASQPRDLARLGLSVKLGERVTGVRVVAAEGAAVINGVIKLEREGDTMAAPLRVFLVPAEPENADNVVRFYQTEVQKDNTFSLANLAPGRYLALVRAVSEVEANEVDQRPVAWNDDARVTLRLQALSANQAIDLGLCQRFTNFTLKFATTSATKKVEPKKGQP